MNDHPVTPAATPPPGPGELHRRFGDRWQIELDHQLGVWSAVRRSEDGRHIRVLIGRTADELLGKLTTAEQAEPPEGACPGCGGGGAVPAVGCACTGPGHTCTPRTCPACGGTGRS